MITESPSSPLHLLPALRDGRRRLAERANTPIETVPERVWRPDEAKAFAAFVAFARDDLREEGLADYADFKTVEGRWFACSGLITVPLDIPEISSRIYVYYSRKGDGWTRDDHNFQGSRYGVGNWYYETLGEAMARAEGMQ